MRNRSFFAAAAVLVFVGSSLAGCPDDPLPDALECERDADCRDDGSYCNGPRVCVMQELMTSRGLWRISSCQRGEPPCASELCNEEREMCACPEPDADGDGDDSTACGGTDCNDEDARVGSGRTEICDRDDLDEDCNETTYGERDADGDHSIDASCCNGIRCGLDCDDTRPGTHPFAVESCDERDNDCDGAIDEGVLVPSYTDADGDGWGTGALRQRCAGLPHFASVPGDCDDTLSQVHPGAFRCVAGSEIEFCDDDATWSSDNCPGLGLCVPQPDGTGVCLPGEGLATQCGDGIDNDLDDLTDAEDPQCTSALDNTEAERECADGDDNDTDALLDFPNDPGCVSADDDDEQDPASETACSNGLDDDGDGSVDFAGGAGDPGCLSAADTSERQADGPTCDNGLDDNHDAKGAIDYPADVVCLGPDSDAEHTPACSNGLDDDFDGLIDSPNDKGCSSSTDDDERGPINGNYPCDNGFDDDSDGVGDYPADPGCMSSLDSTET